MSLLCVFCQDISIQSGRNSDRKNLCPQPRHGALDQLVKEKSCRQKLFRYDLRTVAHRFFLPLTAEEKFGCDSYAFLTLPSAGAFGY